MADLLREKVWKNSKVNAEYMNTNFLKLSLVFVPGYVNKMRPFSLSFIKFSQQNAMIRHTS